MDTEKILSTNIDDIFTPELISSLIIISILIILGLIIFIKAKKTDPLKRPKGLMLVVEMGIEKLEKWTVTMMGEPFRGFTGYFVAIISYLFLSFIFGLTGLASPMTVLQTPLSLSLIMFVLIHFTAIKYQRWSYFKRYIDPVPLFLPINLISMWAPLISTSMRIFGNAVSGWTLMGLIYYSLNTVSEKLFGFPGVSLATIPAAVLHLYFDLFSAYIQTLVFCSLSALFIAQERPDENTEINEAMKHAS